MWISVRDRPADGDGPVDIWRRGEGRIADCKCHRLSVSGPTGVPLAQWYQLYGGYAGGATVGHWREKPGPPGGA